MFLLVEEILSEENIYFIGKKKNVMSSVGLEPPRDNTRTVY